ncbi:MAG: 3-deoxy-8-phosphooctulonate synthase [Gemmatimonadetes bacterium]|nr:3-deoxy-8-phosphooctulonate synthase [Gemmatimonadota bacterium]
MFEYFTLIAGPCVLEGDALNLRVAEALARLQEELGLPVVFKASFDKANRADLRRPRGPGLEAGLDLLARVRSASGLRVLTDIHEPAQAEVAAAVVDVLQIPAFLCRQTDLVVAAGATKKPVNLKKGQWMAPEHMAGAVEKARTGGASEVAITERGTFFGYGDLVVDMRSFARIRATCGVPAIFDGSHSVQRPGRHGGASGGDRQFIRSLALAAVAAGCDGLFLEVHPDPAGAPSDAQSMLPLAELQALIEDVLAVRGSLERIPARA